jgi:transposase
MAKRRESTFERLGRLSSGKLNRKQRRELQRRLYSADPGLERVHRDAAGIDVGNGSHFVAVPPDRDPEPVREFGCWTADLQRMADWLKGCGIQTVAMQSTGVYWIALHDVLEQRGFQVYLVNARHTQNLPGRKSDVQESQWLMKLHTYGLLRNSFRPPEEIRAVRTIWRLRDRHVAEAGRCVQHMQKALTRMNVQLANTISDISGVSGQAILRAILQGERDPRRLAALRDMRIQASQEEIVRSLEGHWQEDLLFELRQAVQAYDFSRQQMRDCDRELQKYLASLPTRVIEPPQPAVAALPDAARAPGRKDRKRKPKGNAPAFDLAAELQRIAGVNLTTIDGIDVMTAQTILAELGTDMGRWPTEAHLASWLGLSPNREVSGGKVVRQEPRRVNNRVATALRMAANSLLRSQSYLGARYRHLRTRLGAGKAIKAMAHYLARLVYRLLSRGQEWVDHGRKKFEHNLEQRELAKLQRKATLLGYRLVASPSVPA